ncbi:hypothetical protein [Aeromonas phage MJG]|uniref:Uncharacterized protein n=1 Tax=Aeromonas phage MJG TaxID=2510451 RepID=A0A5J5ZZG1_9CAUD|nr:hypothetical protein [Aeromonas phage MJG]
MEQTEELELFEKIFSSIEQGLPIPAQLISKAEEHGIRVDAIKDIVASLGTEEGEDDFDEKFD